MCRERRLECRNELYFIFYFSCHVTSGVSRMSDIISTPDERDRHGRAIQHIVGAETMAIKNKMSKFLYIGNFAKFLLINRTVVSQSIRTQVNSYLSQFVLILVNSYSKFWSIRTHLVNSYSCRGQFVLILVNSYSFWSVRTHIQMSTN